jgi:hypothetical protein
MLRDSIESFVDMHVQASGPNAAVFAGAGLSFGSAA